MSADVVRARNRLGNATSHGRPAAELEDLRRDLAAAKLEKAIQRIVAEAPPLRPEQAERIAALLWPASRAEA